MDSAVTAVAGGVIVVAVGLYLVYVITGILHKTAGLSLVLAGTAVGVVIIALGLLALRYPERHRLLGGLIMLFGFLSWLGTSGGYIMGLVVSIIGGIMTVVWKPPAQAPPP